MLKIVIADSYDQVSEEAFKIMRQVVEKENPVLGLATGSTPVGEDGVQFPIARGNYEMCMQEFIAANRGAL